MGMRSVSSLVLLGLLLSCGPPATSVSVGASAPSFELPNLDGGTFDSRSLAGEIVVLNFWATWCQPCWREIPELSAIAASRRARVVSVALDEEGRRTVAPFVERRGIDYPVLIGDQEVFQRFHGVNLPYTLVLDGDGVVVSVHRGPVDRSLLERDLEAAAD